MQPDDPGWFNIHGINTIDSPALIIYKERVVRNINTAIAMVDDVSRLRPHVKTHKSREATRLMMDAGIHKFKCATIAEAEMLAITGAKDVLLAYQPIGPKLNRFTELIKKYPETKYSCLIDNIDSANKIANTAIENNIEIQVYIDINIGMNRTGISPREATGLYTNSSRLEGISPVGLHAYDGHLRSADFNQRTIDCDNAFEEVIKIKEQLQQEGLHPVIIAGGSPTFPVHAKRKNVECSPGTFVYWDGNYDQNCGEQDFVTAALVISRIISLPGENKLCLDLGHKSIAAENDLQNRVHFLNAPDLKFISQSEEHLVAEVPSGSNYKPGDILYGLPFHICPTIALYERGLVAENNTITSEWKTIARDRKITL